MKWKNKINNVGDRRVITTFLLFPETLRDETRWLEFSNIYQEYYIWEGCGDWKNLYFV